MEDLTCDRKEFLGRNGTLENPVAMTRTALSGVCGAGHDPCAAYRVKLVLEHRQEREITILLGEAATKVSDQSCRDYRLSTDVQRSFEEVHRYWDERTKCH